MTSTAICGPDRAAHQFLHASDQLVYVHRFGVKGLSAGERQQPMSESRRALGGASGHRYVALEIAARRLADPRLQQFEAADDPGQQIVEIVGETAGQLTHRLHLLALTQRLLRLAALGDVDRFRHEADNRPLLVANRAHREIERAPAGGQVQKHLPAHGLAAGDRRDGLANNFAHAGRVGEPGGFPERLADDCIQGRCDAVQRGRIGMQHLAVGGEQPLV